MRAFQQYFRLASDIPSISSGLSLEGTPEVYQGQTRTFQINNYDSFSTYVVSGQLNPSINNTTISVAPNQVTPVGMVPLVVVSNGAEERFNINVLRSSLSTPVVSSPNNNAVNVAVRPTLTLSALSTPTPSGIDTHLSTVWEIATDVNFGNLLWTKTTTGAARTSTVVDVDLPSDVMIYIRARALGAAYNSAWSDTVSVITAGVTKPTVTSITGQIFSEDRVTRSFTANSSSYSGVGTHSASQWQVLSSEGSVVHTSGEVTGDQLRAYAPITNGFTPVGGQSYFIRVRYKSNGGVWSAYSDSVSVNIADGRVTTYNTQVMTTYQTSWTVAVVNCVDNPNPEYYNCDFSDASGSAYSANGTCDPNNPFASANVAGDQFALGGDGVWYFASTIGSASPIPVVFVSSRGMPLICNTTYRLTSINTTTTSDRQTSRYTEF